MVILISKNKNEFRTVLKQLNASNIPVLKTRTPGYFAYGKLDSSPGFLLFMVVIIGIILGILLVGIINSVWFHQIGDKPQNLSGMVGWLPVIFEVTIFFAAFIYLMRFISGISKKEKEDPVLIDPIHYYCFLDLKNDKDREYILKNFETHQIIEC